MFKEENVIREGEEKKHKHSRVGSLTEAQLGSLESLLALKAQCLDNEPSSSLTAEHRDTENQSDDESNLSQSQHDDGQREES